MFKNIDLFAGIGGIRLGFERAFGEIETVFVSEIDKHAVNTYKANHPTPEVIHGDICEVKSEDIPDFDICLAGFPCQAFSSIGLRKGFEDTRGTLFFEVARICKDKQPKVMFCENVKGLLTHDKGRTFEVIRNTFDEIGYNLFWKVLDTKDYGLPQHRERVYMVAFRKDLGVKSFDFPAPQEGKVCIKDFLDPAPVGATYFHSERMLANLYERGTHGHGFVMKVTPMDGIVPTIVCSIGSAQKNTIKDDRGIDFSKPSKFNKGVNSENIRTLTERECFRLQGFPEDFKIPSSYSRSVKQAGNSVSVNVISAIAEKIRETLS